MAVTIATVDLARILSEAAVFAETSPDIPSLHAVQLEADGGRLIAVATNRFQLGASAAFLDGGKPRWQILLSLNHVKLISAACRAAGVSAKVELLHIAGAGGELRMYFSDGGELKVVGKVTKLPPWRQLVTAELAEQPQQMFVIDPQRLAKFGRIKRKGSQMRVNVPALPNRAVTVMGGADFVGLLMPMRYEHGWLMPEWAKP